MGFGRWDDSDERTYVVIANIVYDGGFGEKMVNGRKYYNRKFEYHYKFNELGAISLSRKYIHQVLTYDTK